MFRNLLLVPASLACVSALVAAQGLQLTIETTTGTITGLVNGTTPNVRQFLSIPFAEPPVGDLRWEAPQPLNTNSSVRVDATQYPKSCPQFLSASPSVYNQDIIPWIPYRYDQPADAGESLQTSAEDCLYLAVWTPANATKDSALPVLFFITGGGFNTNGVYVPAQIPDHWVERTQSHIVVTINYRLNIFGFPNAAGLPDQNLGLLDQRAALEWVSTNIASFGGDPTRITMWGQSAGAASVDYHNFAFPTTPLVTSFFAQSGSVFLTIGVKDPAQSNFSFVATQLGCDTANDTERLSCMRDISAVDITTFVGQYGDNATQPAISFAPVPDEKVVWANYTAQYEKQAYANLPMIYTTTAIEGVALATYPDDPDVMGPNMTEADGITLNGFLCPAALSSQLRTQINATTPTYRGVFSGNFSNVSPRFWMGAYHASDLSMYFGTHQDLQSPSTGLGSTALEVAVSEDMQDHLLAFAAARGYVLDWPTYSSGQALDFGNATAVEMTVSVEGVDSVCASFSV